MEHWDRGQSNEPIDLVYIINSLHIGGAEIGMCRLTNRLNSDHYDVTVVSLSGQSNELVDRLPTEVTIIDLRLADKPNVRALGKVWSAVHSADVIIGSLFHAAMLARFAGLINREAIIATWRHSERFKTDLRKIIFEKTHSLTDVILADSEPVAKRLLETFDFQKESVHTVPIAGIDIDNFEPVEHGLSKPIVVGSVGRIAEQKNYSALLDVAERLSECEIKFEVAGDGELLSEMINEMEHRSLSNVTFHGELTDIPGFLANIDIYFQPSLSEGLCITVLEAMAAGLPVVGSNVGGIGRNISHGESGFLYEPDNIEGFVSGVETLSDDPQQRKEFGTRGRQTVINNFTQEVLVSEFEKAIRK